MHNSGLAPRDELERLLAEIWCDVLGVDTIGVLDDFYDVGGHSLLAMSLSSRVTSRLHVDFPVRAVAQWPTIASQAEAISRALIGRGGVSPKPAARPGSPEAPSSSL